MPRRNNYRPVLSQIRLKNFKSVKEAEVDLKLLTVVVGKNSSGKSTLLQSILVLSQAVSKRGRSRHFPLNGEFVKLGYFSEVKNFSNKENSSEILLGFTINSRLMSRGQGELSRNIIQTERNQTLRSYSWDGHIIGSENVSTGPAVIEALQMKIETFANDVRTGLLNVDISKVLQEIDVEYGSKLFNPLEINNYRLGESVQAVDGRVYDGVTGVSSSIDIASLSGGLPDYLFRGDSKINSYAQIWWDQYSKVLNPEIQGAKAKHAEQVLKENQIKKRLEAVSQAAKDIRGLTESGLDEDWEHETHLQIRGARYPTQDFFQIRASQLSGVEKMKIAKSMVGLQEASFRTMLKSQLREPEWDDIVHSEVSGETGALLFQSNMAINDVFSRRVKYLGPLRQEPKTSYDPGPERDDLGVHGEFTAGVLLQRSQVMRKEFFPLPSGERQKSTFSEALSLWLKEFGLIDAVSATDRGRSGIALEVLPLGSTNSVDLTSVGVGVSQVLPVLLLCLITKPNNIVVIEQPELHLHPAMQLKLADFLLACARTGRQLIVETHSEHIVNRLRLRSMEIPEENANLVRLLFAEQENGNTVYRSSDVNELGGLDEDWPEGFLDVGANEAASFMRVSIGKMREQKQTK